jgi:hypothetical protein
LGFRSDFFSGNGLAQNNNILSINVILLNNRTADRGSFWRMALSIAGVTQDVQNLKEWFAEVG